MEKLKLNGEFTSSRRLPGAADPHRRLRLRQGQGHLPGTLSFGSAVSITNPFVSLENFNYSTTTGLRVDGFSVGAGNVTVTAGSFTGIGTDLEVKIGLDAGHMKVEKVEFTVATG